MALGCGAGLLCSSALAGETRTLSVVGPFDESDFDPDALSLG